MRTALLALVPLFVLGCSQEPVSPRTGPMPSFEATSNMTRGSFFQDVTLYVPCLAQDVRFHGEVPYVAHLVVSASGDTVYTFQLAALTPVTPPFVADALTSGTTYYYKNGQPINQVSVAGPSQVVSITDREVYRADNGDQLSATFYRQLTINANGDVTVDRFEYSGFQCSSQ